jgi:hypothetical protein
MRGYRQQSQLTLNSLVSCRKNIEDYLEVPPAPQMPRDACRYKSQSIFIIYTYYFKKIFKKNKFFPDVPVV